MRLRMKETENAI